MRFELDESLLVGHDLIDRDHRELMSLVCEFFESVKAGADKHSIYDDIDEISVRFSAHFERENQLMVEARYTDTTAHIDEHRMLLGGLGKFLQMIEEAADDDLMSVAGFIDNWVVKHVTTSDKRLAKFLRERAAKS